MVRDSLHDSLDDEFAAVPPEQPLMADRDIELARILVRAHRRLTREISKRIVGQRRAGQRCHEGKDHGPLPRRVSAGARRRLDSVGQGNPQAMRSGVLQGRESEQPGFLRSGQVLFRVHAVRPSFEQRRGCAPPPLGHCHKNLQCDDLS